jgi:hypothetical protein
MLVLVKTTPLRKKEFMERGGEPSNRLALLCLEKRANCEKYTNPTTPISALLF